jgi:UDP-3-O-[3-hydroxymyristoyl] glucosamine N-acyltransferase
MQISSKQILDFLNINNIHHYIYGKIGKEYTIASMFNPITNGFYFFNHKNIPDNINKSLILTNNKELISETNTILLINDNPQIIFYKIIDYYFKEKSNGIIQKTSIIHPEAKIGKNVQIDNYCIIGKCKIGDNSIIKSHCTIENNTTIGNNCIIENQSIIGARGMAWVWDEQQENKIILPQIGGVTIGNNTILGANTIVVRGSLNEDTHIGSNTIIAPGCRIGHGTKIGNYVHFANNIATGGNTVIGDYSFIGSSATFRPKVNIHPNTIVAAGAVVVKNTTQPAQTLMGVPASEFATKKQPAGMPKPKK